MKKKSNTRKFRFNANVLRNILIGYAILASTLALFLLLGFNHNYQWQQRMSAETDLKMMVRDSMLSTYDEPQRLAGGDKLLLPEVNLSIPIIPGEGKILYNYEMAVEGTPEETTPETVSFVSKSAINALYSDGEYECQRMVVATFGSKNDDWTDEIFVYAGDATMSDGRKIYLYQNTKKSCIRHWQGMNAEQLVRQLKLAQPYQAS